MYDSTKWKLVPVGPTDAMIQAGIDAPLANTGDDAVDQPQDYRNVYGAMIGAAPNPGPPLIQTLHANGDHIAMEATIAQQAQRIADLEAAPVVERQAEPTAEQEEAGCQAYMEADGMIGVMHRSSMGHAYMAMRALEQPAPVAVVPDDNELIEIARKAAVDSPQRYNYMPHAEDAATWLPHRWVIDAMRASVDKVKELNP